MSIFNREEVIDQNFLDYVSAGNLPLSRTNLLLSQTNIRPSELISLFETQILSRHMDLKARILKNEESAFIPLAVPGMKGMRFSATYFHTQIWHFFIIGVDLFL